MLQSWRFLVVGIGLFFGAGSVSRAQEVPASDPPVAAEENSPALSPLATATEHRLRGRYEEALEAYEALLKSTDLADADRIAVWLGQSRVHEETGRWEEAEETITAALVAQPKSPALLARQAELCFLRGRYLLQQLQRTCHCLGIYD